MFKKFKIETPFDFMCAAAGVFFLVAGVVLMAKFTPDLLALVAWLALLAAAFFLVRWIVRRIGWKRVGGVLAVLLVGALALWGVDEYHRRSELLQLNEIGADTSKIELLLEAERRGILPDDKKALLAEARRRGLVPGGGGETEIQRGFAREDKVDRK